MLSSVLAHEAPVHGAEAWATWSFDPALVLGLLLTIVIYRRGLRRRLGSHDSRRARRFWAGLAALGVALLSPLDQLAVELASAHMVQHVLLTLVAAPLLAWSAPVATMRTGAPRAVRAIVANVRGPLHLVAGGLRTPSVAWLLHAATLWFWHASGPYGAALDNPAIHAVEHATFLLTAILFWSVVRRMARDAGGYAALLLFTIGLQGVLLAALLTFATTPWYDGYRDTTAAWGLSPLADQQLAGVIMWVPAGLVYVAVGVAMVTAWLRPSGRHPPGDVVDDDWGPGTAPDEPLRLPERPTAHQHTMG